MHETFLRAMGHMDLLSSLKAYQQRAWLYRTCKNLYIDGERARQRQEALLESLAWETPVDNLFPDEAGMPNPLDLVPARYRDLVEMRYFMAMNSTEIGAHLGIPPATVRWRLRMALKAARDRAEELW